VQAAADDLNAPRSSSSFSRDVSSKREEGAPKVYGRGKEAKEIYARHAAYARARSRLAGVCSRACNAGGVLTRAYTHRTPRRTRRNKYNAPAWAAIVRTHKVETHEKPTVNRRFRS